MGCDKIVNQMLKTERIIDQMNVKSHEHLRAELALEREIARHSESWGEKDREEE